MSTNKKKFFKSASKSTSSETTRPSVKHELKFAPLDQKGFAKQATYKQVKDALLLKIDETIMYRGLIRRASLHRNGGNDYST